MTLHISPKPRALIFDFDGTIVDSLNEAIDVYNSICSFYGCVPVKLEEVEFLRNQTYTFIMKEKKLAPWKIPFLVYHAKKELRKRMAQISLVIGMKELLIQLKKEGYILGILTSNNHKSVKNYLAQHDLDIFGFVLSERNLFTKEKSLRKIISKYQLTPESTCYIGDENRDIVSARSAGVISVGLTYGFSGDSIKDSQPDYLIHSVQDLSSLFIPR